MAASETARRRNRGAADGLHLRAKTAREPAVGRCKAYYAMPEPTVKGRPS